MDNTLVKGDVNEIQCLLDFQKRGFYCSLPFSGSCKYDLIADIGGKLIRIQCKSSTFHEDEGTLHMSATRQTTNTKETVRYKYSEEEIDYFYTSWNGYGFLIPVNEVSTTKYLRVKTPKNGIQETMSIASDYLIDSVIFSIQNNQPIQKYVDNRFISFDEQTKKEKLWTTKELSSKYNEGQLRYIKENIKKGKKAYNLIWKYKEFPEL